MPDIELFSSKLCPFAHRVQLALLEKRIDFWHTEIDLSNKPEWFLVIAPLGEVPVIRHVGSLRGELHGDPGIS